MQREPLADDRPPTARPKGDLVFLLLAARPEKPLLQDELGLGQIGGAVDALHFVLIVDLIALHIQPRPDQLVHAIGQPQVAAGAGTRRAKAEKMASVRTT